VEKVFALRILVGFAVCARQKPVRAILARLFVNTSQTLRMIFAQAANGRLFVVAPRDEYTRKI